DFGEPARDEGRGEGADRSQLGQAAVSGDEGARLLGPHERRSGGAAERALLTPFAALAFACEQLCDISVGERLQGRRGASTFTTGSTRWLVSREQRLPHGRLVRPIGLVREFHAGMNITGPSTDQHGHTLT